MIKLITFILLILAIVITYLVKIIWGLLINFNLSPISYLVYEIKSAYNIFWK